MGSRLRSNPEHLFEVFTEVARPGNPEDMAFVLQKYPEHYAEQRVLDTDIPQFAFPGETENSAVDHFSFVLTDEEGMFKFGFCRHAAGSQTCLCIVSFLPWFEIFYKLLNQLAEILNRSEGNNVMPLLEAMYKHQIPQPKCSVDITPADNKNIFSFIGPDPSELPCIPQNRNLTEYYNAVDAYTMMAIFACMLNERRILIVSKKLSRLTACVHGAASLLYPMHWQHIYIPVLPPKLIDYCSAPMPYLIGIHSTLFEKLKSAEVGDAVILNADNNTVSTEYRDLESLPSEVVSSLKKKLKSQSAEKIAASPLGDGVARAFLRTNVALIGGYRQALRFPPGEQITFDEDAFVHSRPGDMQPFLQQLLHAQIFEQFINDRLDKLIEGKGFSDEFDNEVNMEQDKWATQSRYKEWYGSVKKQGKKFRREGKDKWVDFTSKVKDKSKQAVKDLRHKFEKGKDDLNRSELSRNRPATIDSPGLIAQRPPRPPPPDHSKVLGPTPAPRQSIMRRTSYEKARQYKIINMDDLDLADVAPVSRTRPRSPTPSANRRSTLGGTPYSSMHRGSRTSRRLPSEDTDILSDMTYHRVSLDLLGDQDIQTMLKKSYSLEDLTATKEEETDSDSSTDEDSLYYKNLNSPDAEEENLPAASSSDGLDSLVMIDDQGKANNNNIISHRTTGLGKPIHSSPALLDSVPRHSSTVSVNSSSSSATTGSSTQLEQNAQSRKHGLDGFNIQQNAQLLNPSQSEQNVHSSTPSLNGSTSGSDKSRSRPVSGWDGFLHDSATSTLERDMNVEVNFYPKYADSVESLDPQSKSETDGLGFEDNFVQSSAPPPIPPKVPIKRMSSVDSTNSLISAPSGSVATLGSDAPKGSVTPGITPPVPKPRSSINRKPAFYNQQRPQSFRKSADASAMKEARTAFMKSETTKSVMRKSDDLDQFDPLVTGQLAVDHPATHQKGDQEENLLKEWNLNFDSRRRNPSQTGPPIPPKPISPQGTNPAFFSSSPMVGYGAQRPGFNVPQMQHGFAPGSMRPGFTRPQAPSAYPQSHIPQAPSAYPQSHIQYLPRWRSHQHRSVAQLINKFSGPSNPAIHTGPGRPASHVLMRDKSFELSQLSERPTSVYLDGSQDPFSDALTLSQTSLLSSSVPNTSTLIQGNMAPSQALNGRTASIHPGPILQKPTPLQTQTSGNRNTTWEQFD